jgi:hypothetical protein
MNFPYSLSGHAIIKITKAKQKRKKRTGRTKQKKKQGPTVSANFASGLIDFL